MSQSHTREGPASAEATLIAGAYAVDLSDPIAHAGGGQPAFAVRDQRGRRGDLMAIQAKLGAPPRSVPLSVLAGAAIDDMLLPIAHGSGPAAGGGRGYYVITRRPQGEPLSAPGVADVTRPWRESDLIADVLRPAAVALDKLATFGVTHRGIRLSNLFYQRRGQPVTLGCAWAGPPALLQPGLFEPPYSARCHPAGRGEGSIADDVYALGVVLIILAGGRMPMQGLDHEAQIRLKLERGCFAALAGDIRLPSTIGDIARTMLAEDPEHRPAPVLLADPAAARARRVAARPPQRAQRSLEVGAIQAWDARTLAYSLARAPEQAIRLLRGFGVESWLRRILGDPVMAARIEELIRSPAINHATDPVKADLVLLASATAILDPLAPLCWGGIALFPDGFGTLLAYAEAAVVSGAERAVLLETIETMVQMEAVAHWGEARPDRSDAAGLRLDARLHRALARIPGWAGGLARVGYTLNPLLPCRSPLVAAECVVRLYELLPALERRAASGGDMMIDRDIAAFISARFNGRMDSDFGVLAQNEDPDIDPPGHRGLAHLRVLARIGATEAASAWPALAACAVRSARPALAQWRSRSARAARAHTLDAAAGRGALLAMLSILDDSQAREADALAAQSGKAELRALESKIADFVARTPARDAAAHNIGQEIVAAMGVTALAVAAVVTAVW